MAKIRTATPGRPASVSSGVSRRSMPASTPQAITDVAKPVMVCAAMSAHFCVGAVMMMRVPTMGKASANVSMISTPLILSFDMTPVRGRATWPRAEARSACRPCPPSSTPPWGRTIKQVPLPAQAREYARPSRVSNRLPRRALLFRLVVLDIGEAHVVGRGAFQRAALKRRLPVHHVLDLLGEREILVGDALGGVVHQPDLDPGIGGGVVGMMPGGLGEMADGIDHHQRALPAVGLVFASDPAAFKIPMRQVLLEPLLDLGIGVSSLRSCHQGDLLKKCGAVLYSQAYPRGFEPTMEEALRSACTGADRVAASP